MDKVKEQYIEEVDDDDDDVVVTIDDFKSKEFLIKAVAALFEKEKVRIPNLADLSMNKIKEGIIKRDVQLDVLGEIYNSIIAKTIDKTHPDKEAI